MFHRRKIATGLAVVLGLSGYGPADGNAGTAEAAPANIPAAFVRCMSCHSVQPGRNMVGPSLHSVFGQRAANVPGYSYSSALKNSGLTWNEATLDKWMSAPQKLVPGTKMTFAGLPDPAMRKALIDYLATQR